MAGRHEGNVAVVTGASSGIGRATAERFLAEGVRVVVFARREAALRETARRGTRTAACWPCPATWRGARIWPRLAAETVARFGGVDDLVPNAGIAKVVPFAESTPEAIDEQFRENLTGAVKTARRFLQHVRQGGTVLFLTTFLTQVGFPELAIYSASKAALKSFAQTLALELAPHGIRVNSIAPGPVKMPIWSGIGLPPEALAEVACQVTARLMPGRFGAPEDISATAAFLASDEARNIYGQEIVLDGGYTVA